MGEKCHCQDNIIEVRHCRQPSEEGRWEGRNFTFSHLHFTKSHPLNFVELAKRRGKDRTFVSKSSLAAYAPTLACLQAMASS